MNVGEAIDGYIKLRDKKEELAKKHKDELAPITEKMKTVEAWLKREFQRMGTTSAKGTAGGTAFIQTNDSCRVVDGEAFMNYVKENEAFELMDVRASKTVVRDFMENTGEIPPGLDYTQADVIRVRR